MTSRPIATIKIRTKQASLLFITTVLAAQLAALDYSLSSFATAGYENNQTLSTSKKSDAFGDLGLALNLSQENQILSLDAGYVVMQTRHSREELDNNLEISGSSQLAYELLAERWRWNLSHDTRRVLANQNALAAPNNDDARNDYGVSTVLSMPFIDKLTPRLSLNTEFAASRIEYDRGQDSNIDADADPDTDQQSAAAFLAYRLSPLTRIQLTGRASSSRRDDSDLSRGTNTYLFGFQRQLKKLSYEANAGYNELEIGQEEISGNSFSVNLDWKSGGSALSISAGREKTSSAAQDIREGREGINPISGSYLSANISEDSGVDVSHVEFNYTGSQLCLRCQVNIGASHEERDYEIEIDLSGIVRASNQASESALLASAGIQYQLAKQQSIGIDFFLERTDFSDDLDNYQDNSVQINYSRALGRKIDATLRSFYEQRDYKTPNPNRVGQDYDNTGISLTLSYKILGE